MSQAEAARRLLVELETIADEGEDVTDGSENHDKYLYGWKKWFGQGELWSPKQIASN